MTTNFIPHAWVTGGDTGLSSTTIWSVMMGVPIPKESWRASVPMDTADFGRCDRLLDLMPEWRERLAEVSAIYHEWGPLVANWPELTRLYHHDFDAGKENSPALFKRMHELIGEGRAVAASSQEAK